MRNTNGQKSCQQHNTTSTAADAQEASKISTLLTPKQVELVEFFHYLDCPDLVKSLKLVHNLALYHSQLPIDGREKTALHDVKILWELLEGVVKEG